MLKIVRERQLIEMKCYSLLYSKAEAGVLLKIIVRNEVTVNSPSKCSGRRQCYCRSTSSQSDRRKKNKELY